MNRKIYTIQALRALAALLVVITHLTATRISVHTGIWFHFRPLNDFGAVGVDIFFIVSGFIITIVSKKYLEGGSLKFLKSRAWRIVSLYWPLSLGLFLISRLNSFTSLLSTLNWQRIITTITFVPFGDHGVSQPPILVVGWTLSFELFFYSIVALFMFFDKNKYLKYTVFSLLTIVLIGLFFPSNNVLFNLLTSPLMAEFIFGIFIASRYLNGKVYSKTFSYILILLVIIGYSITIFHYFGNMDGSTPDIAWRRLLFWGIPSALLVQGIVSLEDYLKNKIPRILLSIGDASYSMYLIHTSLITVIAILWEKTHIQSPAAFIFTSLVIVSFVSIYFHKYVELKLLYLFKKKETKVTNRD